MAGSTPRGLLPTIDRLQMQPFTEMSAIGAKRRPTRRVLLHSASTAQWAGRQAVEFSRQELGSRLDKNIPLPALSQSTCWLDKRDRLGHAG